MTEDVARLVLKDNYEQTETLSMSEAQAESMLDVHGRLIRSLEQTGKLDRRLESLPSDETIAERKREHRGLTRPELATLLAYTKIDLYAELLDSDVPEDAYLSAELEAYFPSPLPERYAEKMRSHRLRREITATQVVNNTMHGAGSTFVFRLHEETGAPASDIARAYAVSREVFGMRPQWAEIEGLDNQVAAATQITMLLEGRRLVERGARWLLRNRRRPLDIAATVDYFAPGATVLYDEIPGLLALSDVEPLAWQTYELREAGVPFELAVRIAGLSTMFSTFDIVEVAAETGLDVKPVARAHFLLGSRLQLHWLRDQILALPRDDRWRALARAALREDLYSIHRELTAEVLTDGPQDAGHRRPRGRLDSRQPGGGALARDARGHPRGSRVRSHHAAGGRARGAQPDPGPGADAGRRRPAARGLSQAPQTATIARVSSRRSVSSVSIQEPARERSATVVPSASPTAATGSPSSSASITGPRGGSASSSEASRRIDSSSPSWSVESLIVRSSWFM